MAPRGYPHVRTYTPLRARSSSPTCTSTMRSTGKTNFADLFWSVGGSSEPPLATRLRIILFIIVAALCYISKYLWDIYYYLHTETNLSRF